MWGIPFQHFYTPFSKRLWSNFKAGLPSSKLKWGEGVDGIGHVRPSEMVCNSQQGHLQFSEMVYDGHSFIYNLTSLRHLVCFLYAYFTLLNLTFAISWIPVPNIRHHPLPLPWTQSTQSLFGLLRTLGPCPQPHLQPTNSILMKALLVGFEPRTSRP